MTETALRYVAMLSLIPGRPRKVTAQELQEKLAARGHAIDQRSVQRDLRKLSTAFGIEPDDGRPTGWYWNRTAPHVTLPGMDLATALTYELLQRYLTPMLPRGVMRNLGPYFDEAGHVLDAVRGDPLGRWARKIAVITPGQQLIPPGVDPAVSDVVYEALLSGRRFEVNYKNLGASRHRKMVVNPLGLVYRQGVLYLVATTWEYTDVRHLVLHRMASAVLLQEAVVEPPNFDLDRYIRQEKSFEFPAGRTIRLEIVVEPWLARHLQECRLSETQTIKRIRGSECLRVTADVAETEQLIWWLGGLGAQVEVVRPVAARNRMRTMAAELSRIYAD